MQTVVAGIDVSKQWLDVVVDPAGGHRRVVNAAAGWRQLVSWLTRAAVRLVVLEASGGYERGVHRVLSAEGIGVHVGNPWQLKGFMQSQGRRAKSDRIDAGMLARYAAQVQPAVTDPPSAARAQLQTLLVRRQQLGKLQAEEQTRDKQRPLGTDPAGDVAASLATHLAWLKTELARIDRALATLTAQDEQVQRLQSVPGIGLLTAQRLVGWLPELGTCSAKQIAALVGVAPYAQESGLTKGRRVIAGGRPQIRHALYPRSPR